MKERGQVHKHTRAQHKYTLICTRKPKAAPTPWGYDALRSRVHGALARVLMADAAHALQACAPHLRKSRRRAAAP